MKLTSLPSLVLAALAVGCSAPPPRPAADVPPVAVSTARAAMDATTIATSYAILTAPFDGIVTERTVDPGSMANPGAPLLTLEDSTAFRLEVPLDEARATQVVVGQTVEVAIGDGAESPDRRVAARVVEVARIDPTAHSFLVTLDLPSTPTCARASSGARASPVRSDARSPCRHPRSCDAAR